MNRLIRIFLILILAFLLILIRYFESALFYDPLLEYFKGDYKKLPIPEMDLWKLHLHVAVRYLLNSVFSLAIIWVVFKNREILKLSGFIYLVLFVVLLIPFSIILITATSETDPWALFYIRRFLIHPVFLLLLLPAFYFHKKNIN